MARTYRRSPFMKDVTLNQHEQARLLVLNNMMEYQLPRPQAAELLGISERQFRRVLAVYRRDGAAAAGLLPSEIYTGFNHSHLTEVLAERKSIHLSGWTVSRLLNRNGLASAKQHRPLKRRSGGKGCPGRACCYRWTAATIADWRTDGPD